MKVIKLLNGDIDFVNGQMVLISESARVAQLIENALSIRKGEWFYNTNTGLSHEELFKKGPDLDRLELDVTETVLGLEEVQEIIDLNIDYEREERRATIELEVVYDYENLSLEVII